MGSALSDAALSKCPHAFGFELQALNATRAARMRCPSEWMCAMCAGGSPSSFLVATYYVEGAYISAFDKVTHDGCDRSTSSRLAGRAHLYRSTEIPYFSVRQSVL
mmetsp:Transcript_38134/g.94806  ORF Transcript_38134/g.94806 Transcript_38134/m.94806 type:complete len:105 (+) Transcript_38134:1307-1621(+)